MPTIVTTPDSRPIRIPQVTVKTKDALTVATEWTEQPYLRCEQLVLQVNAMDQATFRFEAGPRVRQIGSGILGPGDELDLSGKFVRVEFPDTYDGGDSSLSWTGYFIGNDTKREIHSPQIQTAVGIEYFLDRDQIRESIIHEDKRIGRVIPFNDSSSGGGYRTTGRGNRSTTAVPEGWQFAASDSARAEWSAKNIVEYLLANFHPKNTAGVTSPCAWSFDFGSYVDDYIVGFDPDKLTLFEILNRLLSPRRSLCWWLDYSEAEGALGTATIRCKPLNPTAITLPGGGTLPGNPSQFTLDYDEDSTVVLQRITSTRTGRYTACRTRGARITSTFTADMPSGMLVEDWLAAVELLYLAAASTDTETTPLYSTLEESEKANRNDAFRRGDQYWRVFNAFRLSAGWNGEALGEKVFPASLIGGSASENMTFHTNWLRYLPQTMLRDSVDYSVLSSAANYAPSGSSNNLVPPMAFVKVAEAGVSDVYQYVEKLAAAKFERGTPVSGEITNSYSLQLQHDCPGFSLRPGNGLNHMIALNQMTGEAPTNKQPEVDYQTLLFTGTIEADHYAEGIYPTALQSEHYEELLIDVGDQYRLDYLVPNTIVGLRNGALVYTDGGLLRDDRPRPARHRQVCL